MSTWEAFNFQLIVKTEAVTRHVSVVLVKNSSGVPGAVDAHPPTAKSLVLWMRILHRQSPHPPTASPWRCRCASSNDKVSGAEDAHPPTARNVSPIRKEPELKKEKLP